MSKILKRTIAVTLALLMIAGVMQNVFQLKASAFSERTTSPPSSGFYQNAYIESNGNCTWYAYGRASEIAGYFLSTFKGNARAWFGQHYPTTQTPHVGDIICWDKGAYNLGHVAIVEKVNPNGTINMSQSSWGGPRFEYLTNINPKTYGTNWGSSSLAFQGYIHYIDIQTDNVKPTISNVKVTNIDSSGYTVTCNVSDNVGVTRVAFPTWTHANGQDDLKWMDGTISGNTATFRVKISDHNNEYGHYATHIYAYDAAGNSTCVAVNNSDVYLAPQVPGKPSSVTADNCDIGVGDSVTLSWSKVKYAADYQIELLDSSNTVVDSKNVTGTSASFTLKKAGTYKASLRAGNESGYSDYIYSSQSITVHPDSLVTFKDWDGTVLLTRYVKYNGNTSAPKSPTREGYTFKTWDKGLTGIKANTTITASYEINKYTVRFLDKDGTVLKTQTVEYMSSATPPPIPKPEPGFMFAGWNTEDYKNVKTDSTVTAVYCWENADLPTLLTVNSASRDDGAAGYNVSLTVKNYPDALTRGKIIVSLKTEEGKMVASETENFSVKKGETISRNLYVPYSGVATRAEVNIVGIREEGTANDNTAVPLATSIKSIVDIGQEWSDWSTSSPPSGDGYITESRTEYQTRRKEYTSSDVSSLSGWTKYNTTSKWGAWSSWSSWTTTGFTSSDDSMEVESKWVDTSYTRTKYKYWRYVNANSTAMGTKGFNGCNIYQEINLDYPLSPSGRTASGPAGTEALYGPYAGEYGTYLQNLWFTGGTWQETVSQGHREYRYRTRSLVYTYHYWRWGDYGDWTSTEPENNSEIDVQTRTTYRFKSNNVTTEEFNYKRYKYQNLEDSNYYYTYNTAYADSMGYPGEWEYNKVFAELNPVETLGNGITVYNGYGNQSWYRADINNLGNSTEYITYDTMEDTSGSSYTVSGKLGIADKAATLMVYKGTNIDPTASQLEYVAQTRLGNDGSYSFTFKPREEISTSTGDYICVIGVEGGTAPIYVKTIAAPKPTYKVEFYNDNGSLIDSQSVIEGESAVLPSNPTKTGYSFIGWDTNTTNVHDNLTVKARYEKKMFTVVFADHENNDIAIREFAYGDKLVPPVPNYVEGKTFVNWGILINENTVVTKSMVVTAQYNDNEYIVKFVDADNKVIKEETVPYCGIAEIPDITPQKAGMRFVSWSESILLASVTENIIVTPVFEYNEKSEVPYPSKMECYYPDPTAVVLTTAKSVDSIYYSIVKGKDTDFEASELTFHKYTAPFVISEDSQLVTYSETENKSNSYYGTYSYNFSDNTPPVYPVEAVETYRIKWVVDGKTVSESTLSEGAKIELPENPVKEGMTFKGWNGEIPEYMPANDLVFTAVFEKTPAVFYTLSYNAGGGTNAPESQTGSGVVVISTLKPKKENCDFVGWTVTVGSSEAQYLPGGVFNLTKNTTLYAVWQKEKTPDSAANPPENPIKFSKLNVRSSATVDYGTKVTVTATATDVPTGYVLALFDGNRKIATGDKNKVSCEVGEIKASKVYTAKIVSTSNGSAESSETINVTVNDSFLIKLVAFFRALFHIPKEYEIKP